MSTTEQKQSLFGDLYDLMIRMSRHGRARSELTRAELEDEERGSKELIQVLSRHDV